ncbi:MAG: ABC transporter permease [Lachnospiraceae bacterium]|nr:ABC transporter permease [Lachnospiraceae bacterium]
MKKQITSSLMSILVGLLAGFVVMMIIALASPDIAFYRVFKGMGLLISGPFNGTHIMTNVGNMIFKATPLIMCGLSVAIAFKTGLFNIGAAGQYLMGTLVSLSIVLNNDCTGKPAKGFFIWLLAVLCGMVAGGIWGCIPGFFKAIFGVNEVIVCIMTNWIAANITSWVFSAQKTIQATGKGGYLITTKATGNATPSLGLDKLFQGANIDLGIFIAVLIALLIHVILNKTTFGFELKSCGYNKDASKYSGMNEKRNIILSMAIAGALSGLGAALYYLNPGIEFNFNAAYMKLPDVGFNGIPVALLAASNPIGSIFSALFVRYINMGGEYMVSAGFNRYSADIIIALIIYFAGFTNLFSSILANINKKKAEKKAIAGENEKCVENGNEQSTENENEKNTENKCETVKEAE